jgi:hypothetical protein
MAAIHPTDAPPSPERRMSRTISGTRLVSDVVQTTQFSGTHAVRLLLLLPWVLSAAMPELQRLYILDPPSFSSPVSLFDSGAGGELHYLSALVGLVTLIWSQMLEARRRQRVPEAKEGSTSRWASALGECTAKDARSIRAWSRFDCFEAAVICASTALGMLLTKFDLTLRWRVVWAIAFQPLFVIVIVIIKRMVHAVAYTQGNYFHTWVTDSATPVLFKALLFEVVVLLMWFHASMYAPYPKPQLEWALSVMLGTGNNSRILCDSESAFQASFSLPFEFSPLPMNDPLECDEPTCGYATWRDLCEARRLAPLADQTKKTVSYLILTVPIGLLLIISLIGNGRIARGSNGELKLKGLLAPHILLALGLGLCALCIGIYFTATFLVHAPQLMSGRAPADPVVCMASSACGKAWNVGLCLGGAIFVLLPVDTLGRFLKQRSNRNRSYFLSYKQDDKNDGAVQMLYNELPKDSAWLDKYADDRSEEAMVAGVTKRDVFVAIISPNYFSSSFCCLEMHTALSKGKRVLVVWNQSKFTVQHALGWIPPELSMPGMLTTNELLPIQEDIQMAKTCVARIEAADIKPLSVRAVPNSFGTDPKKSGKAFVFGSQETRVEAITSPK